MSELRFPQVSHLFTPGNLLVSCPALLVREDDCRAEEESGVRDGQKHYSDIHLHLPDPQRA